MKMKKLICAVLALITVVGAVFTGTVGVFAADDSSTDEEVKHTDYLAEAFKSPEEKIATMRLAKSQDGYDLYIDDYSGEIAFVKTGTNNYLFSNPYDLADGSVNRGSAATRQKLMSQIAVTYEANGTKSTMYSYKEAALRDQITVKNIKNGIRVEYTIGEIATTRLVPRMISKDRFELLIKSKITDKASLDRLMSFYKLYDTSDRSLTERQVKEIQASFPVTKQFAVYVCTPDIETKELKTCESIIKAYCPNYTYEEMDQDHADCDYTVSDKAPPNFKMAIEYTISEDGLEARLPANGIRFDEENFALKSIDLLPYMGAGRSINTGYTFIPDGSGTLIRFEDVKGKTYNVSRQMYGEDFAYHEISSQHSETMRMPVFGVVEDVKEYTASELDPGKQVETGNTTSMGYFAVITEGDSMATLKSEHGGNQHGYNNVYAIFEPRPSDKYKLSASVSVNGNSAVTKTTPRKYSGSYRIQYTLLGGDSSDESTYEASYVGMAKVYRNYLEKTGQITRLTADDVNKDMPLYIETLGTDVVQDTFASVPITVNTPLTSFDDVKTMYDELSDVGITNIDFRLTGYYNNGLSNTYPAKVDFESAVGGSTGFKDLLEYASDKDFGVYPDFDLAYVKTIDAFDGVSAKRDYSKSMDGRYMSRREYDAATQEFSSEFGLIMSPSRFKYFVAKLEKALDKYDKSGLSGISLSTLGTDLNSDFDEDDPYNREDSKGYTQTALETLSEKYGLMVNGGNAYTLKYTDHIISLPTESSNYLNASEAVPFEALVLHGYVNYSGNAVNMEGDVTNALLKSIENGASLYFILCYQNTSVLKQYKDTSKYYSVAYDIWKDDIIEYYNKLNDAMGDLQTSLIVDHEYMDAYRLVSDADADKTPEQIADEEAAAKKKEEDAERDRLRAALEASRGETSTVVNRRDDSTSGRNNTGDNGETRVDTESGTVVRVEYEGGANFIINYNSFEINVNFNGETYTVPSLDFVRVDAD